MSPYKDWNISYLPFENEGSDSTTRSKIWGNVNDKLNQEYIGSLIASSTLQISSENVYYVKGRF